MKTTTTPKASFGLRRALRAYAAAERAAAAQAKSWLTSDKVRIACDQARAKARANEEKASAAYNAAVTEHGSAIDALNPEDSARYVAAVPAYEDPAEFIGGGGGQPQPPTKTAPLPPPGENASIATK